MEQNKEKITVDFGKPLKNPELRHLYPKILFYHKYYGIFQHREISELSGDTFKKYIVLISNGLKKEFNKLKNEEKKTNYKNEINSYLDIINNYKKRYWKNKNEIKSLNEEIKLLEMEYKKLLLKHKQITRNYQVLHRSFYEIQKKDNDNKKKIKKYENEIVKKDEIIIELFSLIQNKKEYLLKNPKLNESLNICIHCFKQSKKEKKKCIHPNCLGICEECCETNESKCQDMCLACNKKREIQCPICLETCKEKDVFKNPSKKCEHAICHSCFTSSYFKANKPIDKCPLCRVGFK